MEQGHENTQKQKPIGFEETPVMWVSSRQFLLIVHSSWS